MNKIRQSSGDEGYTYLIGDRKILKDDIAFETIGTIDELNSHLGLLFSMIKENDIKTDILTIQKQLQNYMSAIARFFENKTKNIVNSIDEKKGYIEKPDILVKVADIEKMIAIIENNLNPIKEFVSPGINIPSAQAHIARTVCRRAERHIVTLYRNVTLPKEIIPFFNRLSDYLFALACYLAEKPEK